MIFKFFLEGTLLREMRCPAGSPVPRVGETIELDRDSSLFDVVGVAYSFVGQDSPPEVTIRIEDF